MGKRPNTHHSSGVLGLGLRSDCLLSNRGGWMAVFPTWHHIESTCGLPAGSAPHGLPPGGVAETAAGSSTPQVSSSPRSLPQCSGKSRVPGRRSRGSAHLAVAAAPQVVMGAAWVQVGMGPESGSGGLAGVSPSVCSITGGRHQDASPGYGPRADRDLAGGSRHIGSTHAGRRAEWQSLCKGQDTCVNRTAAGPGVQAPKVQAKESYYTYYTLILANTTL